jgi:hypothetical protein
MSLDDEGLNLVANCGVLVLVTAGLVKVWLGRCWLFADQDALSSWPWSLADGGVLELMLALARW